MAQLPSNKIMQIMQARSNGYKKICVCVGGGGWRGEAILTSKQNLCVLGGGVA